MFRNYYATISLGAFAVAALIVVLANREPAKLNREIEKPSRACWTLDEAKAVANRPWYGNPDLPASTPRYYLDKRGCFDFTYPFY